VNTLRADVIEVPSNSSYELSLFSSKVGSAHGAGRGVVPEMSSSVSIDGLWPEINSVEGVGARGATVTATRGHLGASSSRRLSGDETTAKGKVVIDS
jgi:hypothetical protein